jgi:hypothetical protein
MRDERVDSRTRRLWALVATMVSVACNTTPSAPADAGAPAAALPVASGSPAVVPAAATAQPPSADTPAQFALDYCRACAAPAARGTVTNRDVKEASGLVASKLHPDVFYVNNDSGDTARFFAVSAAGGDLGTFALDGVEAKDWEDIARGPCDGGQGSCVYLADIGDNPEKRDEYVLYRVSEPREIGPGLRQVQGEALPFAYPDGSHNAEVLLVHPETGAITVVTKVPFGASGVYELPVPVTPGQRMTLKLTGTIAPIEGSPRFTGGDVHPEGAGVLLRTYTNIFFYPMRPGQTVAAALAGSPCVVPDADEEQGESVAWQRSGSGWVTVSEGSGQKLNFVDCEKR